MARAEKTTEINDAGNVLRFRLREMPATACLDARMRFMKIVKAGGSPAALDDATLGELVVSEFDALGPLLYEMTEATASIVKGDMAMACDRAALDATVQDPTTIMTLFGEVLNVNFTRNGGPAGGPSSSPTPGVTARPAGRGVAVSTTSPTSPRN